MSTLRENKLASVLIVDDDPDVRRLVEMKLELEGLLTITASNGEEALAALENESVDLVVLDLMMPVMDGLEACRRLRADQRFTDLPVLMLTARAHYTDVEKGFEAGATDYVVKPFSPRELLARVRSILDRSMVGVST